MSDEENSGKTTRVQQIFTNFIIRGLLFVGIIILLGLFLPGEIVIYIALIIVLIFILKTEWIQKHPFFQLIFVVLLVGLILFVLGMTLLDNTSMLGGERTASGILTGFSKSFLRLGEGFSNFNPLANWKNFQDKQVDMATGGYFVGEVEESKEDTNLGLQIERIESFGMDIYEGQEAVFWATLKGKTLGDKIINGIVDCNASEGNDKKLSAPKPFSIYSYEMDQFECKFSSLPGGKSVRINFWAEYDFQTLGYTKAYFIDQERLRTLRSLNKDPLIEAGINDRNPSAIYTDGPVRIGIGTSDYQPIPVNENNERVFILGVTLQTKTTWRGKISRINNLEIQIHKSMIINPDECDHKFIESNSNSCKQRCNGDESCETQCEEYNFYVLTDEEKERIKDIKDYRSFKCPVNAYTKYDLIGDTPISTRFVRVIADYNFRSELERIIFIKKASEMNN
jgi:energy-coupling factor transporter transmembrane protein EcfT